MIEIFRQLFQELGASAVQLEQVDQDCLRLKIPMKIKPGAKREELLFLGAELVITLRARPIEGEANAALVDFFSKMFSLPKKQIQLIKGELSRTKVFLFVFHFSKNKRPELVATEIRERMLPFFKKL